MFQFHLVRLKFEVELFENQSVNEFQFHLVRLKSYVAKYISKDIEKFQFHLVRLKYEFSESEQPHTRVSIPSGTIKIKVFNFRIKKLSVSIPSGTIKIGIVIDRVLPAFKFQFHLVRLKSVPR